MRDPLKISQTDKEKPHQNSSQGENYWRDSKTNTRARGAFLESAGTFLFNSGYNYSNCIL